MGCSWGRRLYQNVGHEHARVRETRGKLKKSLHPCAQDRRQPTAGLLLRDLNKVTMIRTPYYSLCTRIMPLKTKSLTASPNKQKRGRCHSGD